MPSSIAWAERMNVGVASVKGKSIAGIFNCVRPDAFGSPPYHTSNARKAEYARGSGCWREQHILGADRPADTPVFAACHAVAISAQCRLRPCGRRYQRLGLPRTCMNKRYLRAIRTAQGTDAPTKPPADIWIGMLRNPVCATAQRGTRLKPKHGDPVQTCHSAAIYPSSAQFRH